MEARLNEIERKGGCKSPKDGRPIRPLSAYNIFFHLEKKARMKGESDFTSGSFTSYVSTKWKKSDTALKLELEAMAKMDKERYDRENREWKANMLKEAMGSLEEDQTNKSHSFGKAAGKAPVQEFPTDKLHMACVSKEAFPALPFKVNRPNVSDGQPPSDTRSLLLANAVPRGGVMRAQSNVHPIVTPFQKKPVLQAKTVRFPPRPTEETGFSMCAPFMPNANNGVNDTAMESDDEPQATPSDQVPFQPLENGSFVSCGMISPFMPTAGADSGFAFQADAPISSHGTDGTTLRSEDNSQVVSGDNDQLKYMRAYIQGYKAWTDLNPTKYTDHGGNTFKGDHYFQQVKDEDRKDPSFMRGYNDGFKAASEMWSSC